MPTLVFARVGVLLVLAVGAAGALSPVTARADDPARLTIPSVPAAYRQRHAASVESAGDLAAPSERAAGARRTRGPRVGFESVGGLLGIGASAIVGVLGWGLSGMTLCQSPDSSCAVRGALVFGALSSLVLAPLGVVVGSRATRGNGGYLWSVLGAALGLAPGLAGGYWTAHETGEPFAAIPVVAVLTIVGAVLGYELSADAPPTSTERLFQPVASLERDGLRLGLRGTL
jgi:hypothetical protein